MRTALYTAVFLVGSLLHAQNRIFTAKDGLPARDVTCLLQSQNGHLWVGTSQGLTIYDGYSFRLFGSGIIPTGKIKCLFEDSLLRLWIGTWDGLFVIDQKKGAYWRHFASSYPAKSGKHTVNCISGGSNGEVFVADGSGSIFRFRDPASFEEVFVMKCDSAGARCQISGLCVTENATYIIEDYGQVKKLDRFYRYDTTFKCVAGSAKNILPYGSSLLVSDRWGEILECDRKNGTVIENPKLNELNRLYREVTVTQINDQHTIFTGYSNGAFVKVQMDNNTLSNLSDEIAHFNASAPQAVCAGKNGVIWIGTGFGLIRLIERDLNFTNLLSVNSRQPVNKKASIRGICEDYDGTVYIGGYAGLFRVKKGCETIEKMRFMVNGKNIGHAYYPYRLSVQGDYLWICSEVKGLYRVNKKNGQLEFPLADGPQRIEKFFPSFAMLCNDTVIWLGTNNGLYCYNIKENKIRKYSGKGNEKHPADFEITEIVKTPGGELWVGTKFSGLYRYSPAKGFFRSYEETAEHIPLKHISSLFAESDSVLWIGTRNKGLVKLNTTTGKSIRYTKESGLAGNSIASITKDRRGYFWIATFNGLSRLDPSHDAFLNYFEEDGISDNEFNLAAGLSGSDGRIWLGGLNGVNVFDPREIKKTRRKRPLMYLGSVTKGTGTPSPSELLITNRGDLSNIVFDADEQFLALTFFMDDYTYPGGNTFRYRVNGLDKEWTNLGNQNAVRINHLPAGNYTLQIKGINSEGIASANMLSYKLKVTEPFYLSTWFYISIITITALAVYLLTRYLYMQRSRLDQLRTKISSDLHDEVGGLLTRITIQAELIKQGIEEGYTRKNAEKIASTSRKATEAMSDILWAIDARNENISHLLDRFHEYAGETLYPLGIDVQFDIIDLDTATMLNCDYRQNLLLIFKEAVNNIAKHARASRVEIQISGRARVFKMRIHDNGLPTPPEFELLRSGQGIKNMKMRAGRLGGSVKCDLSEGYTVEFSSDKIL